MDLKKLKMQWKSKCKCQNFQNKNISIMKALIYGWHLLKYAKILFCYLLAYHQIKMKRGKARKGNGWDLSLASKLMRFEVLNWIVIVESKSRSEFDRRFGCQRRFSSRRSQFRYKIHLFLIYYRYKSIFFDIKLIKRSI